MSLQRVAMLLIKGPVVVRRSSPRLELLHQFDSVWYNMVYGGNMVADAKMHDIP